MFYYTIRRGFFGRHLSERPRSIRMANPLVPTSFVVTLGETMVLLVPEGDVPLRSASRLYRSIAGAESNVAIGLARLGVRSGWISRVGDDGFGEYICEVLRGEGVDVSHVIVDPSRRTGLMVKELQPSGKSRVFYYRSGSAASALSPTVLPLDYLRGATHLHLTGITPALSPSCAEAALSAVRTVSEAGGTISFDVNLRLQLATQSRELLVPFIQSSDVVFVGEDEARWLFDAHDRATIQSELIKLSAGTIVLKRGAEGALVYTQREWIDAPGFTVHVVDETGAGDAFAAAFLACTLQGCAPNEALEVANVAGALTTTVPSDIDAYPTWPQVWQFLTEMDGERR
jgi:2-dehydro-3-deoxygluconokinase